MTYRLVCARCNHVFLFRSMERIGLRVRQHVCEAPTPDPAVVLVDRETRRAMTREMLAAADPTAPDVAAHEHPVFGTQVAVYDGVRIGVTEGAAAR